MKLYKDRSREKICGVCAGVAEEFGWDLTLVRIVWALVAWCYGIGLAAYIICAIVMPDKSELDRNYY